VKGLIQGKNQSIGLECRNEKHCTTLTYCILYVRFKLTIKIWNIWSHIVSSLQNKNKMKQINYKIKKGHVSYLWRGEGIRWFKARFKNTKRFIKNHFIELLVKHYNKK